MERAREIFGIALVAGLIFFINLGSAKLWDRDEPRNAGCAKEMLERGNLVTPIFNDELRDAKPVLLYWFIMAAYQVFGVTEFSARFWSAALAVGTVLCTYFMAQRMFDRRVGVLSSFILATSLMFGVAARAATPDSMLIFFGTAALALFVAYAFPKKSTLDASTRSDSQSVRLQQAFPRSKVMAVLMYGLMAFGVLAKGPIGFLMPTAIIGMYLLIVTREPQPTGDRYNTSTIGRLLRRLKSSLYVFHPIHFLRTCWGMRLVIATVMVLVIAGPWYFLVGIQTEGDFLRTFFLKEHFGRSTSSFENHSGTVFYYPLVLSVGFFPWSVFALPVLVSIFQSKKRSRPMIFLICWVTVQVGLFTLVQTKLPSYVTPCYPALAIICGYHLTQWTRQSITIPYWIPRISFAALGLGGLAITLGISYAAKTLLQASFWMGLVGVLPLTAGLVALVGWKAEDTDGSRRVPVAFMTASSVVFSVLFFGWVLPEVSRQQRYDEILLPIVVSQEALDPQSVKPLGTYACLEPTWVFYGGQPIYELVEQRVTMGRSGRRVKNWKPKPRPGLREFLVDQEGRVITREELVPQIEQVLGRRVSVIARSPYFMKNEQLVLIELPGDESSSVELPDSNAKDFASAKSKIGKSQVADGSLNEHWK